MNLIGIDLDGTLEDSRRDMIAAVQRVRARFGLPKRPDAVLAPWINQGMDPLYRRCFDDYLVAGAASACLDEVRRAYEIDYHAHVAVETRLYPGVAAALDQLASLGRVVVVTNKPEKISRRLLEALAVDQCIAAVIGGDSCAAVKPDPAMLCAAAGRVGFDPKSGMAVMIGDTTGDIEMGRGFGARTVWCAWGYSAAPGAPPDFTAQKPDELPGLVQAALR